jgi:pyrimidine operon attenuation protein/uracil phosphoribosyltransferase
MPWDLADRHVVLVDDVLYTGRTIRAALNELFDWGRPASVTLAVLISRDGRELPVEAAAAGARMALPAGRHIKLRGPEPLHLEVIDAGR